MTGSVEACGAAKPIGRCCGISCKTGHDYEDLKKVKLFIYGHVGTCDLHGMWVAPCGYAV